MDVNKLKDSILAHNKAVQDELTGFAKGTEQALGWVLQQLAQEENTTVNSGPTVVATQEK